MKSSFLLSVVIPSFNTGNYIIEAIFSVIQDVPSAQIIVVDDGSTDNTVETIKSLNLANIELISLTKNSPGGAGHPSNIGIEHATGKFITFVDSDDFFYPGYLSNMLSKIQTLNADICVSSYLMTDTVSHVETPAYDSLMWKKITKGKAFGQLTKEQYLLLSPEPWRKIYHSRLFKNEHVRFPVNGWFNEDYPFHWFCGLSSAKDILFLNCDEYFHRVSRAGQTTDTLDERIFAVFDHTSEILKFIGQDPDLSRYSGYLLNWLLLGVWKVKFLNIRLNEYYTKLRTMILTFDNSAIEKFFKISLWEQKKIFKVIKKEDNVNEFLKTMRWVDSEK